MINSRYQFDFDGRVQGQSCAVRVKSVSSLQEDQAATSPEQQFERSVPAHSALPLAFCLLVAGGIMLGGIIRQRFEHPFMDAVALLIVLVAVSAAIPPLRYAIGEVLIGLCVVFLVMPPSFGLSLNIGLELVAGAVLLGGAGALHMERYPPSPPDPEYDGYWRTISLTAFLLDLLVRRRRG
jgi:hypothetical protein